MADHTKKQLLVREPPRCMYPGEFLDILWRYKHPRLISIGIERSRWGERARNAVNLAPHGTIWFSDNKEKTYHFAIPCNCIPYTSLTNAEYDEKGSRWKTGDLARGWRTALSLLSVEAVLYPHKDLSYLIGEDTWSLVPKIHRL